eukprot:GHUV01015174.1.p1 GENE.GHUV01015174.1~~GHUV01015174.1.p1  ORF type:complete len:413 (+),score=124.29 GHUV01015174.1:375-1613(+)
MLLPRSSCKALSPKHAVIGNYNVVLAASAHSARQLRCQCHHTSNCNSSARRLQHVTGLQVASASSNEDASHRHHLQQRQALAGSRSRLPVRQVQAQVASSKGFSGSADQPQQQTLTVANASLSSTPTATTSSLSSSNGSLDATDTAATTTSAAATASAAVLGAGPNSSVPAETAVLASEGSALSPSDSADDLCAVDEVDTPEALTDLNYTAPPSPGADRRYKSGYVPGTWEEGDEVDPFLSWWKNRDDLITLAYAVGMGGLVATSVFVFDVSIQYVHDLPDIFAQLHVGGGRATGLVIGDTAIPFRCIMPIGAGLIVAYLQSWGFSPALKFLTRAIEGVVDDSKNAAFPTSYWQVFRRAVASVITLGSGASLGPEAPSVELGANTAAVFAPKHLSKRRQRMLVAAGAAAGGC